MQSLLLTYIKIVDSINERLGRAVSWLSLLLVLLVCYEVFNRKFFNTASAATGELQWHLFALIFLLGAGYTLKHDKHVRVDVFYSRFSEKQQAWINFIGFFVFMLPFCWVAISASLPFIERSYSMAETSPDSGGLPMRYLIKSAIPVGLFFFLLQGSASMFKSLLRILQKST
jgi:TRAP-type mannitol/chloroaromatic compound transport system permease small subunit